MDCIILPHARLGLKMKNVAKKSTSLKPNNPLQNGLQERLSNGLITGDKHDVDDMTVEEVLSEGNGDEDTAKAVIVSDDKISETQDDETTHRNSTNFDENSSDSLLEVSCVNVVDDPNTLKSPFNEGNTIGSRSSTPASVIGPSSKHLSGETKINYLYLANESLLYEFNLYK